MNLPFLCQRWKNESLLGMLDSISAVKLNSYTVWINETASSRCHSNAKGPRIWNNTHSGAQGYIHLPLTSSSIYRLSLLSIIPLLFSNKTPVFLSHKLIPSWTAHTRGERERNWESKGWWNPKALRRTVLQYLGGVEWAPLLLSGLKLKTLLLPFTVLKSTICITQQSGSEREGEMG